MRAILLLSVCIPLLALGHVSGATTWYVAPPPLGSDSNPGTEAQPFATIQKGIDVASNGDTVIVAEATYLENIYFNGKNILLTSTDPLDPDVVASTIIDGNQVGSVVTFSGTETADCILSGFTIQNGLTTAAGGGICGDTSGGHRATYATIEYNIITNNKANGAGGLHACRGTIQNNTIVYNSADLDGGGLGTCNGTIRNNTIEDNIAYRNGGGLCYCDGTIETNTIKGNISGGAVDGGHGGGLYKCAGIIRNNVIEGNSAGYGGGLCTCAGTIQNNIIKSNSAFTHGGGLADCHGTIRNNTISDNFLTRRYDERGGGLHYCSGNILSNAIVGNSAGPSGVGGGLHDCTGRIENNLIASNSARNGGGVWCYRIGGGFYYYCLIQNNTIVGNSADDKGGGVFECDGAIRNCIIWGNTAGMGDPQLSQSSTPTYSCIQDWAGGEGNIAIDPRFINVNQGDYRLKGNSPCKDAGANYYWFAWPQQDADGNCRLAEGAADMGCYECGSSIDTDGDLLSDADETTWETDPNSDDSDEDGLQDGLEVLRGSDPLVTTNPGTLNVPSSNFPTIQQSLCVSIAGDEIIVSTGTYRENLEFAGPDITLRSSDPSNKTIVNSTILEGVGGGAVVSFVGSESAACVLEGFTIRNGQSLGYGGGICGGRWGTHTHATIQNNTIESSSALSGGGLALCNGIIQNNVITGNWTAGQYTSGGGGLYQCHGTIQNNTITNNQANGGYHDSGGGLHQCGVWNAPALIQNNTITGNSAGVWGGGLFQCAYAPIRNNLIAGNSAGNSGGGLYDCAVSEIRNNTITGNSASEEGGGIWIVGSLSTIKNCILWGNSAPSTPQLPLSTPTYCCIQDWTGGGTGNISDDPLFADPDGPDNNPATYEDNDYRLSAASPCIGAGINEAWMDGAVDLDGNPRIVPVGGTVDMGAYENQNPTAVELISFAATRCQMGTLLRWRTGYEVSNLGFHVHRQEKGQITRVTPELIAGSALFAGAKTRLTAGRSYSWWDVLPEDRGNLQYWLEDVDLSGERTWHGPVVPTEGGELPAEFLPPTPLSQVGRNRRKGDDTGTRIAAVRNKFTERPRQISCQPVELLTLTRTNKEQLLQQADASSTESETQRDLAAGSAVKISVREAGWYQIRQPELLAAGLDRKVDPRYLQLLANGEEQPILVSGEDDGRFNPKDAIEFYGEGLDTPYTDTQTYWLVEGIVPGKRIPVAPGVYQGITADPSFLFTVDRKERTIFFAALKNGEEENFFGPLISNEPVDQILSLPHIDPSPLGDALLQVALQGVTRDLHRLHISLNDEELSTVTFEGQANVVAELPISQSALLEGDNIVTLAAGAGEGDVSLVDFVRLTYWHTYAADDDALRFTASGGEQVTVREFSRRNIRVVDVTDPQEVQEIPGMVQRQQSGYAITINVPGWENRTLLAFTDGSIKNPAGVAPNFPSQWHRGENGTDIAIVTHGDFIGSVEPLKAFREGQGWSVSLIDVQDLYDEFSFGAKTPYAVRDFLHQARDGWQTPPRFVLLVGDASFDPRNYLGLGDYDYVPTKLVETAFLETACDDWFADMDGDGVPEMAVGRLPVRTLEEATVVVEKVVDYENTEAGDWTKKALFVADKNDDFDFVTASRQVGALLPEDMTVEEFLRGQPGFGKTGLLQKLNEGQLLVNYIGHGSVEIWKGSLLTSQDAGTLANSPRLPFLVSMTCMNGLFHDLYTESLAEAMLKAESGGAVAVWTSSGLTFPGGQVEMNKELVRLLFSGESLTIGEAIIGAKAVVKDQDIRRTWILFGDPTTRIK